jgi:hypothetical protein
MKRVLKTAVFTLCLAALSHGATVPVQNLSTWSLGAEYFGMLNGHEALYDFDSSALGAHFLRLHYAPAPYLRLSAGLGASHSYADPHIKGSRAGFAATAGFGLYLPKLLDFLSLTAGYDGFYMKASERQEYYHSQVTESNDTTFYVGTAREGRTASVLHTPYIGAIFHAGRFVDIEIGGKYYLHDIWTKNRSTATFFPGEEGVMMETRDYAQFNPDFSLMDQVRLYATLTLHERESGAYLTSGFSYALADRIENKSHLANFSFWAQVGIIMRDPRGNAPRHGEYSGAYIDLKIRQDRMAETLQHDVDDEVIRRAERGHRQGQE